MQEPDPSRSDGLIIADPGACVTEPEPGMLRQVLAHSPALTLVRHQLRQGWRGTAHRHRHEQLVYVIKGAVEITVNGVSHVASTGDSFIVEPNAMHQATALEDSVVLDLFTPAREEYVQEGRTG